MMASSSGTQHLLPLALQGIRGAVLVELKKARHLTTREIATRLRSSLNGIRHHLKGLEEEGLVEYERQHRGVGAPTYAYRLTPTGEALFPRRYEATLTGLLNELIDRQGRAETVALLESRYAILAQRLRQELAAASPSDRLQAIATLLSEEGYMAEGRIAGSAATLTEHNCAIHQVAERFPEICAAEAKFLGEVLGGEVVRERHILSGCSSCEYRVRFDATQSGTERPAFAPSIEERP